MGITDSQFANLTGEIRPRQGSQFVQLPNLVEAGETLADGQLVYANDVDGKYYRASRTTAATHCVLRSGEHRLTAVEIATLTGSVQEGEPTMAITGGPGTIDLPIAATVDEGDELTVDNNGFATRKFATEGAYVIGYAKASVSGDANNPVIGEVYLTLPARWSPAS